MSASFPPGADEYKRTRSSEDDDAMDQDSSPEDKKSTSKKGGDLSEYNLDDYDEDDTIDSASATISDVGSSRVDQQVLKETGCMEVQEVQEVQEVSRITVRISSVA